MIDLEAEAQALAAMMEDHECLETGLNQIKPDWFSAPFHRKVFGLINRLYIDDKPINPVTVATELGSAAKGNGTSWLIVRDAFWTKQSFAYYIEKLEQAAQARALAEVAQDAIRRLTEKESVATVAADIENKIYSLASGRQDYRITTPKERAERILETVTKRMDKKSNGGIRTSYLKLNRALNGGMLPGQLIILAAQTGRGKTAFAMNLERDIAIVQKYPMLYVNTEMGEEQIDVREAAILTAQDGISHSDIARGNLTDEQLNILARNLDRMHSSGSYSITVPDLTITSLIATARRFKIKVDMKVLVVDYVGRMQTFDPKLAEHQVLRQISKQLKTLAQQLNITVIMLAQMTEEERLEGARVMKNECDLFCYLREMTTEESASYLNSFNYWLNVEKNRDGPTGKIPLKFEREKLTFRGESVEELARAKQQPDGDTPPPANTPSTSRKNRRRPNYY